MAPLVFTLVKKKNSSLQSTEVNTNKYRVVPQIRFFQDVVSLPVLEAIKKMLGQGILTKPSKNRSVATLSFSNNKAISLLINICEENCLHGAKQLDFLDFCKASNKYTKKEHLNPAGLLEIISIVQGMNNGRKFE